jgi:hypothetical protein
MGASVGVKEELAGRSWAQLQLHRGKRGRGSLHMDLQPGDDDVADYYYYYYHLPASPKPAVEANRLLMIITSDSSRGFIPLPLLSQLQWHPTYCKFVKSLATYVALFENSFLEILGSIP